MIIIRTNTKVNGQCFQQGRLCKGKAQILLLVDYLHSTCILRCDLKVNKIDVYFQSICQSKHVIFKDIWITYHLSSRYCDKRLSKWNSIFGHLVWELGQVSLKLCMIVPLNLSRTMRNDTVHLMSIHLNMCAKTTYT